LIPLEEERWAIFAFFAALRPNLSAARLLAQVLRHPRQSQGFRAYYEKNFAIIISMYLIHGVPLSVKFKSFRSSEVCCWRRWTIAEWSKRSTRPKSALVVTRNVSSLIGETGVGYVNVLMPA
jgi:hypothetical protein